MRLPKYELDKDNTNRCAKVDRREIMRPQPYTRNDRQLRNAENGRIHLPQGREHQFIIQYQMINPENIHVTLTLYRLCKVDIFNNN